MHNVLNQAWAQRHQKIKILLDVRRVYGALMQRKIYALDCAAVGARGE
jgi:hypothetical protein